MTTKQLSIFIENKSGTMLKVLQTLKEADIQIIASSISDTVEYGIYRIICTRPEKACEMLKSRSINVTLTEVFAVELDNTPGKAADALVAFAEAGVSINYMYSFLVHGKGILIFRTDDTEKSIEIIRNHHIKNITTEALESIL